jgi:hypothetical protein
MLTHRAEGSGLEAKTALRGSVLQAISQITPIKASPVKEEPPTPEAANQDLGWTAEQLRASGVAKKADGTLTRGDIAGSDVLNTLELARLAPAARFQSFLA